MTDLTREDFSRLLELGKEVADLKVRVEKLENPPKKKLGRPKKISNV